MADVKNQLSEYLARARKKKEAIIVTHHGKPYALIQPLSEQDLEELELTGEKKIIKRTLAMVSQDDLERVESGLRRALGL
ncbi:MAG: hypothetical protein A2X51_00570 [Candidatus Rokubacteria bacterium GWC2_70_24]|nr:MAG: hypothetical protein A2X51_00570 [Candidatus Rokubacteria bacterium GWC2_70_24]